MLGTPLVSYAKNVVNEVISVGRAGTLIDWEDEVENRVYASLYAAENILKNLITDDYQSWHKTGIAPADFEFRGVDVGRRPRGISFLGD